MKGKIIAFQKEGEAQLITITLSEKINNIKLGEIVQIKTSSED